jgi:GT2 family glycosyltransferase
LLLSADALDNVGFFDERFFLYCEEVDWQRRAIANGWKIRTARSISCLHVWGGTTSNVNWQSLARDVALEQYIRKWFGATGWQLDRWRLVLRILVRSALKMQRPDTDALARLTLLLQQPSRAADRRGFPPSIGG